MVAAHKVRAATLPLPLALLCTCTCAYYASGRALAVMAAARSLACVFADAQVPSRAHGWDWNPGSIDAADGPPRMRSSSSFMVTAWRMRVPAGDLLIIIEI